MSKIQSKKDSEISKVLGEAVFPEPSENILKNKRNLITVSFIGLIIVFFDLHISKDASFLGLSFENVEIKNILLIILIICLYNLVTYVWNILDAILFIRNRITGMKLTFKTAGTFGEASGDYPDDIKQSSLYNWWKDKKEHHNSFKDIKHDIKKITSYYNSIENAYNSSNAYNSNNQNLKDIIKNSNKLELKSLDEKITKILDLLQSDRIEFSLKRYDNWFQFYQKEQILKYIILEIGFPILLGIISLTSIALEIYKTT